jgi:hypothetical protein
MTSTLRPELLEKYAGGICTFVETGTARGEGLEVALVHGFEHLHSVEANPDVFAAAKERFAGHANVTIWQGDGAVVLPRLLEQVEEPAVFWLDSHWSTGEAKLPRGTSPCPLLGELRAIAAHPVKGHVVLIDDCRYFWKGIRQWENITMCEIILHVMAIDPAYWITMEPGVRPNDILVAKRVGITS